MKSVIEEIYDAALKRAEGQRIRRVAIGAGYTYVELDDGGAGVSYSNREGGIRQGLPGNLENMRVDDALQYLLSGRGLEVSFGLAATNALVNRERPELLQRDALVEEELDPNDVVVLVGYFPSYVRRLKDRVKKVYVLEILELASRDVEVYPWWAYSRVFSDATRIYMTGTTISNHTVNYILPSSIHIEHKFIIGPSTPMIENPFAKYKVEGLSGSIISNRELCFKIVSQGGGAGEMFERGCLKKVFLPIRA
ncbi:MAG: Rossmann-like domain-containing protein [Fervidicoccaceae archaeon]|jgi:uncharacterized protein (DUF4213/DUF364 family)